MFKSLWGGGVAVVLLCSPVALADDTQTDTQPKSGRAHIRVQVGPAEIHGDLLATPQSPIVLGDYWLGVACTIPSEALRSQLNLSEGEGLVVENVVPDSPAAKAGLQQHDVLTKVGDEPLGGLGDLIDAIEEANENEMSLELIRGAKKQTVAVAPAKRPETARAPRFVRHPGGATPDWLGKILPDGWPRGSVRYRIFHPGTILPPGAAVGAPLPGNLTVNVTKHGNEPAKITVERNGEKWEVTGEDLDELPEDIRPHVSRMLGNVTVDMTAPPRRFDVMPDIEIHGEIHGQDDFAPRQFHRRMQQRLQRQMEEMNRQMENMQEVIEELQEGHP